MNTVYDFYAGQRVRIGGGKFYGLATVKKRLQKNVDIVMDDGRAVRAHPSFLTPLTQAEAVAAGGAPVVPIPIPAYVPAPQPGTVVRVSDKMVQRHPELSGDWIVCGGQGDKSRLFRLNNTNGRYWRIPNSELAKQEDVVLYRP